MWEEAGTKPSPRCATVGSHGAALCQDGDVQVLGHRGSLRPGPENSVAAVREALAAGADGVEVDIRRTRDGQLVCLHDPALLEGLGERPARPERFGEAARTFVVDQDAPTLRARGVP